MTALFWLTLAATAADLADTSIEAQLQEARAALLAGEIKVARKILKGASEAVEAPAGALTPDTLGTLWLLHGVVWVARGRPIDKAMAEWRQALVLHPELPWDAELLPGIERADLFDALRRETLSQLTAAPAIPAPVVGSVSVDGLIPEPDALLPAGQHLVQARCTDGTLASLWTDLTTPPPWDSLCAAGIAVPVIEEDEGDEFEDMMPSFGPAEDEEGEP